MDENLENLHILSTTYNLLYKCCEEVTDLYLDLVEKESVCKKNFKELLKKYKKTEGEYFDGISIIETNHKTRSIQLLQNNLKIKVISKSIGKKNYKFDKLY